MRIGFFIGALLLFAVIAKGQNLVPNPSFEILDSCPYTQDQVPFAVGWNKPTPNSPDLYNSCSSSFSVPQNWTGWQMPHTGNGYAGLAALGSIIPNGAREYIQTKLIDTLVTGKKYGVRFFVSLADSSYWAVDRIGAYLSKDSINNGDIDTLTGIPQIENPQHQIITDKTNWIEISGVYIAAGGERFITIGNFYVDSQTDTISHLGPFIWAYFYIDDVSVYDYDTSVPPAPVNEYPIAITPNPGDGNFMLSGSLPDGGRLEIYDMLGQIVHKQNLPPGNIQQLLNLSALAPGVYSLKVFDQLAERKRDRLIIAR